ncbi:MAG: hypothetical protein ACRETD_04670 [Steroidobacteraceae bacterium]
MQNSNDTQGGGQPGSPALAPALIFLMIGLLVAGEARQPDFPGAILYNLAGALFVTGAAFLASAMSP